jgi:amino acid adenylation domain-containing protein
MTKAHADTLSPEDRCKLLERWNDTASDYPRNLCIHQVFEQEAARRPDAVAVCFADEQLTYRQLNERANQIAHRLRQLGVGPEVMVGTLLDRSLDLAIGLLGILKAGGAFVPLDPSYPMERLEFMAADIAAPVMLVQDSVVQRLSNPGWLRGKSLSLDENRADIARESVENPANHPIRQTTAENLAYVMYTSGSTGRPKGVMVSHRAVVRLVKNTNYIELSEREVFLQFSPVSFDASTLEIWGPLLNGGCLAMMPPEKQSLSDLGTAIRQYGVTTLWLTAGLFNVMVEQRLEDLKPLKQLVAGGDVLSSSHVRKALEALPGCRLINGYGPTEGTTFSCCHTISAEDAKGSSIPIGRPISNTQVYLLDSENELVRSGEAGELCIGGDGLARGYLNQPALTAAKFVRHPFRDEQEARIYKTGDLARYRPDGSIEFLGRTDNQVKISGYRIEPGEIEAVVMQHPAVRSTVVVPRQDTPGEKKLIAYVVPGEQGCSIAELRAYLQKKLPAYMLPAAFVLMDSLPLSPNGKVDRAALPAPQPANGAPRARSAQSEMEQKIESTWMKVLGLQQVGADENFFDVGGDSLQLLMVHAEIQKTMESDFPLTDLFEYSTIRTLAQHLAGKNGERAAMADVRERARQQKAVWAAQTRPRENQIYE